MTRLRGDVDIYGVDDDWPEFIDSDDTISESIQNLNINLENGGPQFVVGRWVWKWGGECRLEVDMYAQALSSGDIQVLGNIRFYEGDSEDTNQLEDDDEVSFIVGDDQDVTQKYQLTNETWADSDWATVTFDLHS
jgi:hypothetical protein